MSLLANLGVNGTIWIQLAIFVLTVVVMYNLVFVPYLAAHLKRLEMTEGNQENAEKLNEESSDLTVKFENVSKEINTQIKIYYDKAQKEAQELQAKTLQASAKEAEEIILSNRLKLVAEVESARKELKKSIPDLSQDIELKFLSRDA